MSEKNKPVSIEYLAEQGEISAEAAASLKGAWVNTADELYSRMKACTFSASPEAMKNSMEKELGLNEGKFDDFMSYIKKYVSSGVVNAGKVKEYPLGVRTG